MNCKHLLKFNKQKFLSYFFPVAPYSSKTSNFQDSEEAKSGVFQTSLNFSILVPSPVNRKCEHSTLLETGCILAKDPVLTGAERRKV